MLDPEGNTVKRSLNLLGYEGVEDVRIGKKIYMEVDAPTPDEARKNVEEMCEKLLANPVIHDYKIELERR